MIALRGEDRVRYLNGLVTCQIEGVEPGCGVYGFFTDNKGHILSDLVVRVYSDRLWVETPSAVEERITGHLNRFIVADRVEVEPQHSLSAITVVGIRAVEAITKLADLPSWNGRSWIHAETQLLGRPVRICDDLRLGIPALSIWLESEAAEAVLADALAELPRGFGRIDESMVEAVRIRAGLARFGVDFGPENLPQETAIDGSVSTEKGCYLGQEVVARLHYRGQVARALRAIRFSTPEASPIGSKLAFDDREAGVVTSAVGGSRGSNACGIAMLQRSAFEVGTVLVNERGEAVEVVKPRSSNGEG